MRDCERTTVADPTACKEGAEENLAIAINECENPTPPPTCEQIAEQTFIEGQEMCANEGGPIDQALCLEVYQE